MFFFPSLGCMAEDWSNGASECLVFFFFLFGFTYPGKQMTQEVSRIRQTAAALDVLSRVASLRWKPVHTRWHLRLGSQRRAYKEFLCRYEGIWKARAGHTPPNRIGLWVYRSGAVFYPSFVFPFPISFCFGACHFPSNFLRFSLLRQKENRSNATLFSTTAWPDCRDSLCFFCSASCFYFSASFLLSYFLVVFSLFVPFLSTELWVHGIFWGSHGIKRGLLRA